MTTTKTCSLCHSEVLLNAPQNPCSPIEGSFDFLSPPPLPGHFPDLVPHLEPDAAVQRLGAARGPEGAGGVPAFGGGGAVRQRRGGECPGRGSLSLSENATFRGRMLFNQPGTPDEPGGDSDPGSRTAEPGRLNLVVCFAERFFFSFFHLEFSLHCN